MVSAQIDIEEAKAYVQGIFGEQCPDRLTYHNWEHTREVFDSVKEIAGNTELSDEDTEIVLLAALFHDTGYFMGAHNHEERSADIASEYLSKQGYEKDRCELVREAIMATKMGVEPQDLRQKVIKDADLHHLSTSKFNERSESLRKEMQAVMGQKISKRRWLEKNIEFLEKHHYHTDFAKESFSPKKAERIAELKSMLMERDQKAAENKGGKKKKGAEMNPGRGIETMFRTSLRNHVHLSAIADTKANTLISINAIIISIVLSALFPKLDSHPYLVVPGMLLLAVCSAAMIVAIISTIPKVTHGMVTRQDIQSKSGNLLFFGNFHKMSLDEYTWGMNELMKDRDYLYNTMINDFYHLGIVLNRKYNILRSSYIIFTVGLVAATLSFVFSYYAYAQNIDVQVSWKSAGLLFTGLGGLVFCLRAGAIPDFV